MPEQVTPPKPENVIERAVGATPEEGRAARTGGRQGRHGGGAQSAPPISATPSARRSSTRASPWALIDTGASIDEARKAIIDKFSEERAQDGEDISTPVEMGAEEHTKRAAAVENALLHRIDSRKTKLEDGARELRGMTLMELGEESLRQAGFVIPRGLSRQERAKLILGRSSPWSVKSCGDALHE